MEGQYRNFGGRVQIAVDDSSRQITVRWTKDPKALDPEEEGEPVTPTRKVKRKLMYERFKPLVDGMYDDVEDRLIAGAAGA